LRRVILISQPVDAFEFDLHALRSEGVMAAIIEDVHAFCQHLLPGDVVVTDIEGAKPNCFQCADVPGLRKCKLVLVGDEAIAATDRKSVV